MELGAAAFLGIRSRWMIGLGLSCILGVAGEGVASAQARKLSGELAHGGLAPEPFAITPDGARVVYLGTHASEFHFDLFSAPADGSGEPVRLSARFEFPESGDAPTIGRFWILPDGRVAFAADHVFQEYWNYLFVVPADGSAPQQLVASSQEAITHARFTSDGLRAVYLATEGSRQAFALFSAPLDGSALPTRLAGAPSAERGNVRDFQLSADGRTAVFTLDEGVPGCEFCEPNESVALLAVPVDGSAEPIPLAHLRSKQQNLGRPPHDVPFPDFQGETITSYALAPDGSRVLFATEALFGACPGATCRPERALWSVPLAGGAFATRLFAGRALGPVITADSSEALFLGEVEATGQLELRAVPLDGSQPARRLHGALPAEATVYEFALAPGDESVVFRADLEGTGAVRLFAAGREGTPPRALSPRAVQGGSVDGFRIAADGSAVLFRADLEQEERFDLYAAPLPARPFVQRLGGPPPAHRGRLTDGLDVLDFTLTPDSGHALFTAFEDGTQHLFAVPLDGGPLVRLSGDEGGRAPLGAPDGSFAVYEGAVANVTTLHVFRATLAGGTSVRIDARASDPVFGDVASFLVSADGQHVVYRADTTKDEFYELFRVGLRPQTAPVRLDPPGASDQGVWQDFQLDPGSTHAVYRLPVPSGPGGATRVELFASPLNGAPTPVRLHGELPPGAGIDTFAVGAGRAVYRADLDTNDVVELYSCALDGSGGALRLSGPLVANGDVGALYLAPDGTRVLYLADALVNDQFELFAAPIDGSTPAVRLSGPLGAGRDVVEPIVIAPDGRHVLFAADRDANDAFELFSVPIDGSAAPLDVTPNGGRDVFSARFSADSSAFAFTAFRPGANVSELFAAPLGVAPTDALVTLAPTLNFAYFELTPDGSRLAYMAGRSGQRYDLFGVPRDGSTPPVRLNPLAPGDRDVQFAPRPRLSADGTRVVYLGDPILANHDELFSAPVDGSAPAVRLHPPMPESGRVVSFELVPGASEAVYLADAEADNLHHLYRVPLDGSRPPLRVDDPRGSIPRFGATPYRLVPGGTDVLFLSDRDVTSVVELFLAPLQPHFRGSGAPTGSAQRGL